MDFSRSRHSGFVALLLVVCVMLSGCGAAQEGKDEDAGEDDRVSQMMTRDQGEKLASSLEVYIDQSMKDVENSQQLKELDSTGEAKERILSVLRKAKENGGVSVTDYETAMSGYKQCMLDRGYKEIILLKESNGVYKEAGHRVGTGGQDDKYGQDMLECGILYSSTINGVYKTQVGNPGLYKNPYEGTLDCLRREDVAPKGYSLDELEHDLYLANSEEEFILNIYQPKVTACLVSNGITIFSGDEPMEELW